MKFTWTRDAIHEAQKRFAEHIRETPKTAFMPTASEAPPSGKQTAPAKDTPRKRRAKRHL